MAAEETPVEPYPPTSNPAVLLGAGSSVEAGVPATFDMTQSLVEGLEDHWAGQPSQALNFVCGALVAYDAAQGSSPYRGLDVERVFAAVELLAERRDLEVTPFVASWHPAVEHWDRPSIPAFFDRNLGRALLEQSGFDRGRDLIVDLIRAVTGEGTGDTYRNLAQHMIAQLRSLVATDPANLGYLAPLAVAARRSRRLTIGTLNYDLAVEQIGSREHVDVHTGIQGWAAERRWSWPDRGIRLLKLHGSIDWCWDEQPRDMEGHMRHPTLAVTTDPYNDHRQPVVVFGQRGKLRAEGPFLTLLSEFEEQLAEADRLLVIGYSFRDDHVNEVIRQWTLGDLSRTIVIVDPKFPVSPSKDFRSELVEYLNPKHWRPQSTVEDRVKVMRLGAGEALKRLFV